MSIQDIQSRNAVTIARHRIDSGYYDTPAVIDETVRRLQAEWDAKNDGERWE